MEGKSDTKLTTEVIMAIPTPTRNLQVLALPTEHHKVNTVLYINSNDYTSTMYVNKASYF